jgi:pilus assembly protein CpaC
MTLVAAGWHRWSRIVAALLAGALAAGLAWQGPARAQETVGPRALVRNQAAVVASSRQGTELVVPLGKSQLLRVDRQFDEVSVGNPEIADVVPLSKSLVYVLGKQPGATNLTLTTGAGEVIAVVDVTVSYDVEGIKAKLYEVLPQERIEVRPGGGAVILSGQVSSSSALANAVSVADQFAPGKVTNLLSVGGSQQVLLAVRFAEVQRSTAKELGLNSLLVASGDDVSFSLSTGSGVSPEAFGIASLGLDIGGFNLDLLFDVLEQKGLIRTLAEPNLIALSGDTASFLAGGEFPIPVAQDSSLGATTITIEFKEFGVSLGFTPTVLGNQLVNLVLNTEVSAIDPTVSVTTDRIVVPGLTVRRAKTTVELRDGQSFAIAGLLQDDFRDNIRQFPWIGDVPVLGSLFRSTAYQRRQTELVVVITPRLVRPTTLEALASPLDRMALPTEADLFLTGALEGKAPPPAVPGGRGGGGIDGPHGYILR